MFFWILIKLNFPDLLEENPSLRKFLNSDSTVYFLDETFYNTHILLFSITTFAAIVIKASKCNTYYIILNSYDVATKYSSISSEKCYLTLLVVLIKTMYISTWPACCKNSENFCQESYVFINHAVKHTKAL